MFQFFSFHSIAKESFLVLFMCKLESASHNTVSFDFSAIHEIHCILLMYHFSVAFNFFVAVSRLTKPCIHISGLALGSFSGVDIIICISFLLSISIPGNLFLPAPFLSFSLPSFGILVINIKVVGSSLEVVIVLHYLQY